MSDFTSVALGASAAAAIVDPRLAIELGLLICSVIVIPRMGVHHFTVADVLFIGLTGLHWASMLWTVSPDTTMSSAKLQAVVLMYFLATRMAVVDRRSMVLVCSGFLAGCVGAVGLMLGKGESFRLQFDFSETATRAGLNSINANYLAYSFSTGLVLVLIVVVGTRSRIGRVLLAVVVLALYVGLIITGARGAVLSAASLVAWIVAWKVNQKRSFAVLSMLVVAATVIMFFGTADGFIRSQLVHSIRETGDLNGRLTIWPLAREVLFDHPWGGIGADAFKSVNPLGIGAHSALLDVGTGLGFVGIAMFVGVIYAALFRDTRNLDSGIRSLIIGAMLVVSVPIFLTGYWNQSIVAWAAIAICSRIAVIANEPLASTDDSCEKAADRS